MTEPQSITAEHVRDLLDADSGAVLGLVEGRVEVVRADAADGVLEIATRDDLVDRLGEDADDEQVEAEADALSIAAQELGG